MERISWKMFKVLLFENIKIFKTKEKERRWGMANKNWSRDGSYETIVDQKVC